MREGMAPTIEATETYLGRVFLRPWLEQCGDSFGRIHVMMYRVAIGVVHVTSVAADETAGAPMDEDVGGENLRGRFDAHCTWDGLRRCSITWRHS